MAWFDSPPTPLTTSRDIDLYAYNAPDAEELAFELDGSLGQASPFDAEFGYYCDGVGPRTAILPLDWEARAKRFSSAATGGVTAIVPDPNDIALSKLCAWRPKDISWLRVAVAHGLIDPEIMQSRLGNMPQYGASREELDCRISALRPIVGP